LWSQDANGEGVFLHQQFPQFMALFSEPSYLSLPPSFYSEQHPEQVPQPELLLWNSELAEKLNIKNISELEKTQIFSGNVLPAGTRPLAQAYAGHQFGHFTMLGDGRAILLSEVLDGKGNRFDIQLKGAGQTPFSRNGDGRATLKSMLREYLISEAMHHLGIPTSRSLAVVKTGGPVYREKVHPGAILTRVMSSHIRVGTFEYARHFGKLEDLKALFEYSCHRHFPKIEHSENKALDFLEAIMNKQIDLIVDWMRVGFIHGVMNTDNMGIAGETFDYGPCAFMNAYHPDTVFSSIDTQGRYAFANQPLIVRWNLAGLAMALLPLIDEADEVAAHAAKSVLDTFMPIYQKRYVAMMRKKLGLRNALAEDRKLIEELLAWMEKVGADYTNTFLVLSGDREESGLWLQPAFQNWKTQWLTRCGHDGPDFQEMRVSNPMVIPRNHMVEDALEAAHHGEMQQFLDFLKILANPYNRSPLPEKYLNPSEMGDANYQTFCGT
jgi:serine/tyrosine/threonine adenylyltransferase